MLEDGTIEAMFTLPADAVNWREGNLLVVLSMLEQHRVYMMDLGFVDPELRAMKISKKPEPIELKYAYDNSESGILRYPFFKDSRYLIIDTVTKEVITSRYIDDRKNGKKGWFIDLKPGRRYWICEIFLDRNKARAEEIAYGYYYGEYGLPKSIINAAEWFDRWGTKEAYQMLAHIFRTDPVLGSEEDAQYYERLAEKEQPS